MSGAVAVAGAVGETASLAELSGEAGGGLSAGASGASHPSRTRCPAAGRQDSTCPDASAGASPLVTATTVPDQYVTKRPAASIVGSHTSGCVNSTRSLVAGSSRNE